MSDVLFKVPVSRAENFVSIDVETDGPSPTFNSMIQLGAVVVYDNPEYTVSRTCSFKANISPRGTKLADESTLAWWRETPEKQARYEDLIRTGRPAGIVMHEFAQWLSSIEKPIPIGWPIGFDFAFVDHYLRTFVSDTRVYWHGHNHVDIGCLAAACLKVPFSSKVRDLARFRFDVHSNINHDALTDATHQATIFSHVMRELS